MRSWTISLITTVMILGQAMPGWAGQGDCGQPKSRGAYPQAVDALYMLHVSVDMKECELGVCDVDADCGVTVRDVLVTLRNAVTGEGTLACSTSCATATMCEDGYEYVCSSGVGSGLVAYGRHERDGDSDGGGDHGKDKKDKKADARHGEDKNHDSDRDDDSEGYADEPITEEAMPEETCGCVPVVNKATTTTTTTMSTTTTSMVTTTTMGASTSAGQQIYDGECAICHSAGSHDTSSILGAPDLTKKTGKLQQDITPLAKEHPSGLIFSQQEIDDLKAFLNSL